VTFFSKHHIFSVLFILLFLTSGCITINEKDSNGSEATQMAFELTKMAFEMEMNAATTEAMQPAQEQPAVQETQPVQQPPAAQVQAPSIAPATSFGVPHDNEGIFVLPSTGTGFGLHTNWTGGPVSCNNECYFEDVTGDGKADFIAYDNDGIWVLPSTGSSFGAPEKWHGGSCNIACYFEDVTGDGRADFIAHDNGFWTAYQLDGRTGLMQ